MFYYTIVSSIIILSIGDLAYRLPFLLKTIYNYIVLVIKKVSYIGLRRALR